MEKPTFASVTGEPCDCGFLERAVDDPHLPIRFNPSMGEYQFEFPSPCSGETCAEAKAYLMIYHCPFCGGAAPPSKRGTLFTYISDQEAARLYRMFDGMRTLEEVVRAVGPPDHDAERGLTVREPEKKGKPPRLRTYRTLRYTRLSDPADVEVFADPAEGNLQVGLVGKHIGPPVEKSPAILVPGTPH
jgi:hypothetical protein